MRKIWKFLKRNILLQVIDRVQIFMDKKMTTCTKICFYKIEKLSRQRKVRLAPHWSWTGRVKKLKNTYIIINGNNVGNFNPKCIPIPTNPTYPNKLLCIPTKINFSSPSKNDFMNTFRAFFFGGGLQTTRYVLYVL